jgi:hypothetical protein
MSSKQRLDFNESLIFSRPITQLSDLEVALFLLLFNHRNIYEIQTTGINCPADRR